MKLQIRRGVFETNSSSTHALCICENDEVDFAKIKQDYENVIITIDGDEFGWNFDVHFDVQTKLNYMFTMITACCNNEDAALTLMNKMKTLLESIGVTIQYRFDTVITKQMTTFLNCYYTEFHDKNGCKFKGYVDHPNETILDLLDDKDMFFKFLFGKESMLVTGNDNYEDFGDYMNKRGLDKLNPVNVKDWKILYKNN